MSIRAYARSRGVSHVAVLKAAKAGRSPLPPGTCAGYYPELNVLIPLWHHDEQSKTPAAKSVPVRATADGATPA